MQGEIPLSAPVSSIHPGQVLWEPTEAQKAATRVEHFRRWLAKNRNVDTAEYHELWQWSVDNVESFWDAIWDYFEIIAEGERQPVLTTRKMPGASWYPNARINYAEHIFRMASDLRPALIARSESEPTRAVSWRELESTVASMAAQLRRLCVQPGDRVASYMPNRPETVAAFLACASVGAIWSSCAPDMGVSVVLDRFQQIEPVLLFAMDSYSYGGKVHDRADAVRQLLERLPSVRAVIHVPGPGMGQQAPAWRNRLAWSEAVGRAAQARYERVAFEHPLWIVYSSGTTGLPKAMVHSHGGIVLTHLKTMALQHDLRPGDRLMFLGSTGWIVWNLQIGALLTGASVVLYDGNPAWPDAAALWRFLGEQDVTLLGCGAAYLANCMKDGLRPRDVADLRRLRAINSTGSPLSIEAYQWVYDAVQPDVWLASISGGTDIAAGFVACAPTLPVHAGEIQCRELGVAAYAFNDQGHAVVDEIGELVITAPMPSMPVCFWGDDAMQRYRESYFDVFPGVWRHGDWIRFTARGTAVIYGRSDSTINRFGIRIGTAEIYRVVEEIPEVRDSLVVDLEYLGRPSFMPLFVQLMPGHLLDDGLTQRILHQVRTKASARHVPNEVVAIADVPRTLSGKKMEVPVRKLLLGIGLDKVANPDAMANPESLEFFAAYARQLRERGLA